MDFKKIQPAHLLNTFGKQENEEAIATALRFTGGDTTVHFTRNDIEDNSSPRVGLYIHDFAFGGWVTQHEDKSYTITQKLIDFIILHEKVINHLMSKGDTYKEVLGLDLTKGKPADKIKLVGKLRKKGLL